MEKGENEFKILSESDISDKIIDDVSEDEDESENNRYIPPYRNI